MKRFQKPYAVGGENGVKFVLNNGAETKSVFAFLEFNKSLGCFEILNKNYDVVEYMDLLGNFTTQPTKFAKRFYEYIESSNYGVGFGCPNYVFYTSLIDFPSKYLRSKEVRQIVKAEEEYKYQRACDYSIFVSLLEKLKYKIYYKNIYKQKIEKMKYVLKTDNENEVKNYYEL